MSFALTASATEEYAAKTGAECAICHVDPMGGGQLTDTGQGYLMSLFPSASTNQQTAARIIRLIMGYIHIITAFLWFGTILYVHLVLKPAYASKGLPRGEVRVGLASMAVMAITGIVLTYYRVPSLDILLHSKFGILLLAKITIFTIMVASALYVVLFIGPRLNRNKAMPLSDSKDLTASQLANFDGNDGRPAYVAFNGRIYNVSESKMWKGGRHLKRHQAGTDLTKMISQAPHDEEKILAMPEVGQLISGERSQPEDVQKKVFFFMAYMNLGFVFVIALILALWRWL